MITKAVFGLLSFVSWTFLLYWEKAICMDADMITCLLPAAGGGHR